MSQLPDEIDERLLFILHYGLSEIRGLALATGDAHIAELADALEILPRYVGKCTNEDMEMI